MKRSPDESARDLLEGLPPVDPGDVAVRRLRQRIIDDLSRPQVRPNHLGGIGRRLAIGGAVIVASTAIVLLWVSRQRPPDAYLASVESIDDGPLLWARNVDEGVEWLTLNEGAFRVAVRSHATDRRVIVRVPEGRIEDLGTVFEVRINGGRTTGVRVSDGHVQLWFAAANGVMLGAGEVWEAPRAPTTPLQASTPRTPATKGGSQPAVGTGSSPPPRVRPPSPRRPGAHQPAANESAEDAAYLELIELLREGRRDEARTAARDYVRRFPRGFRLTEMQALAK